MELDPRFAAYEVAGEWPDPTPPLLLERFKPISWIRGFDDSEDVLHWYCAPSRLPVWPEREVWEMWLSLLQIQRLPETPHLT
jgi:hypothetical protein